MPLHRGFMLKALLFDLDGTLADTDRLHEKAWIEALAALGQEVDHAFYQARISGKLNPHIVADVLPQLSAAEGMAVADAKEARFRELAKGVPPLPGLRDLQRWAIDHGVKSALVTNAPRANAEHLLETLRFAPDVVVLSEELAAGKPDPLPYATALARLGLAADEAVAFEDSPSGIKSAVTAGIFTVAVKTGHEPARLGAAGASLIVDDFADPRLWDLLRRRLG